MSNIGICEYCKYKNTDMIQNPCLGCSAQMGAFEFDLSEHDKQIRADMLTEFTRYLANNSELGMVAYLYKASYLSEQLKEQK